MTLWDPIETEEALEENLSAPSDGAIAAMSRLTGDLILLGAGGKMGPSLAWMAKRASEAAGVDRRVIAVDLFTNPEAETLLNAKGVETIRCDLLDEQAVARLPQVPNVIFMTGMKFGSTQNPGATWAMNTYAPGVAARHYADSRIAAFSTGNVYPFTPVKRGGSVESDPPDPKGEYAMSALGRERVFEYFSRERNVPVALMRLNYACELRYGVLADLAQKVWAGQPIDVTMGYVNVIWQSDANAMALQALEHAGSPPFVVNIAGKPVSSVRDIAQRLGELMNKPVEITGEEAPDALLSNPNRAYDCFGAPRIELEQMLTWIAHWTMKGGRTLGKPTHFEVRSGQF